MNLKKPKMKLIDAEAFAKALVWRFIFSIPIGTAITFLIVGQIFQVITLVIVLNIVMTVAHYFFEMIWPWIWNLFPSKKKKSIR